MTPRYRIFSGRRPVFGRAALILTALAVFLAGCTAAKRPQGPAPLPGGEVSVEEAGTARGWWRARIRFVWPEDEEPRWFLDLAAADRLFKPVLVAQRGDIALWRFHRRAARDSAGHQFSFLFYCDRPAAARIFQALNQSPGLAQLVETGLVAEIRFDDPAKAPASAVGATSDPNWSGELRSAWPYYIMGVSALWLELIHQASDGVSAPDESAGSLLTYYRSLDLRVNEIWRDEAQHALLHHLNALFGYRPMMIRKPMRF